MTKNIPIYEKIATFQIKLNQIKFFYHSAGGQHLQHGGTYNLIFFSNIFIFLKHA